MTKPISAQNDFEFADKFHIKYNKSTLSPKLESIKPSNTCLKAHLKHNSNLLKIHSFKNLFMTQFMHVHKNSLALTKITTLPCQNIHTSHTHYQQQFTPKIKFNHAINHP